MAEDLALEEGRRHGRRVDLVQRLRPPLARPVTGAGQRRAARPRLAEDQQGLRFAARGNEPFWNADVRTERIRFAEPLASRELELPWVAPQLEGAARTYVTTSEESPGRELALRLTEERCIDTMSGERFPYTAELRLDGRRLTGCALEGER